MEPVYASANKGAGVISARNHRSADNVGHIPGFEEISVFIDFQNNTFHVGGGIYFEQETVFARIDIMMKLSYPQVAVISDDGNGTVQFHPQKLGAITDINSVIKKSGCGVRSPGGTDPANSSVDIHNRGRIIAAFILQQQVVIA